MSDSCNLCNEINGVLGNEYQKTYGILINSKRNFIYESDAFVLIPSFGPLTTNHVMLVPKKHVVSFSELSENELIEAKEILCNLQNYYKQKFANNLIFFESGSGSLVNHSGGCIVHAHIHCLEEVAEFKVRLFSEISMKNFYSRDTILDNKYGYIWFKDSDEKEYYCNRPLLPSQFLRYIYAQESNNEIRWNWRKDINLDNILKVIDNYKGFSKIQ